MSECLRAWVSVRESSRGHECTYVIAVSGACGLSQCVPLLSPLLLHNTVNLPVFFLQSFPYIAAEHSDVLVLKHIGRHSVVRTDIFRSWSRCRHMHPVPGSWSWKLAVSCVCVLCSKWSITASTPSLHALWMCLNVCALTSSESVCGTTHLQSLAGSAVIFPSHFTGVNERWSLHMCLEVRGRRAHGARSATWYLVSNKLLHNLLLLQILCAEAHFTRAFCLTWRWLRL